MHKKRVILFDDDRLYVTALKAALVAQGMEVEALDPEDGQALLERCRDADLLLIDVKMPGGSGDVITKQVRRESGAGLIVYLLSGLLDEDELAARAQAAQANGFLHKRHGIRALAERVAEFLGT